MSRNEKYQHQVIIFACIGIYVFDTYIQYAINKPPVRPRNILALQNLLEIRPRDRYARNAKTKIQTKIGQISERLFHFFMSMIVV